MAFTLVLLLSLFVFFIRRRRRTRSTKSKQKEPWIKGELPADDVDREARGMGPHMLESTPVAEVDGTSWVPEVEGEERNVLEAPAAVAEIHGDSREVCEAQGDMSTLPQLMARFYDTL